MLALVLLSALVTIQQKPVDVQTVGTLLRIQETGSQAWAIKTAAGQVYYLALEGRCKAEMEASFPAWRGQAVAVSHRQGSFDLGSRHYLLTNHVRLLPSANPEQRP